MAKNMVLDYIEGAGDKVRVSVIVIEEEPYEITRGDVEEFAREHAPEAGTLTDFFAPRFGDRALLTFERDL